MLTGRRATDGREPRQVRKEAAISDAVCVVERSRSFSGTCCSERNSITGAQPSPVFHEKINDSPDEPGFSEPLFFDPDEITCFPNYRTKNNNMMILLKTI